MVIQKMPKTGAPETSQPITARITTPSTPPHHGTSSYMPYPYHTRAW